jgi:hypothetical protein
MKAQEIWTVVPFSRPNWLENVKENFIRQHFHNKKLIIVENGPAVGCCKAAGFSPDIILTSAPHQAIAKATALDELKRIGAEFWTTWDDDDYYGENYLTELAEASDKAELIGKLSIFVKTLDDKLRLFGCQEEQYVEFIHGPTISTWVSNAAEFINVGKWSEDIAFCDQMKAKGARFWATSRWNFINQRHKNHIHTWVTTDRQMSQGWLYTMLGTYIHEFPGCSIEEAKIGMTSQALPTPIVIEKLPYTLEDSAAYMYARKQAGSMEEWVKEISEKMGININGT